MVPESIFGDNLFDCSQTLFFARQVKDSLAGQTVFVPDPLSFVSAPQPFSFPPSKKANFNNFACVQFLL